MVVYVTASINMQAARVPHMPGPHPSRAAGACKHPSGHIPDESETIADDAISESETLRHVCQRRRLLG